MFTVALVGADGAGKTTAGLRLEAAQPVPLKYLYMGVSKQSSNRLLPTTRVVWAVQRLLGGGQEYAGPPDPSRRSAPRKRSLKGQVKSFLRLGNRLAEEWYRQALAAYYRRRGYVVLFDRHFFADYFAHDIQPASGDRSAARRLHGWMLAHLYPRPDLIILLDAPTELLYARKGEGSLELLERRRQEYWLLADHVPHFAVVDAGQSLETVIRDITALLRTFAATAQVPPAYLPGTPPPFPYLEMKHERA